MKRPPPELVEFLHRHDPAIQTLTIGLRSVVIDELAPCREHIFKMRERVVLVYSATPRVIKDGICLIAVFRKHVNLGFTHGADLKDPTGALEGTGKQMRHVSLKRVSELDRPDIRPLLRQARKRAGLKRAPAGADVVTTVKRSEPAWAADGARFPRAAARLDRQ